jgi:hypothetical protein
MGPLYVHLLWLVLGGVSLPPHDIRQPPGHGIHQVHQVQIHEVLISLVCSVFVTVPSIEVTASWDFPQVWLALVLIIFHCSRTETFSLASFLVRKQKALATHSKHLFLIFARKLAKQNVSVLGCWKMASISTRAGQSHRKNLMALQLLWRIQL